MKKVICSQKAPGAIGPYSQAIEANGMIFVSGQLPIDATTGQMAEGAEHRHVSHWRTSSISLEKQV
jgi:2-iminobutanoate/2-iminopropanoate deaminase